VGGGEEKGEREWCGRPGNPSSNRGPVLKSFLDDAGVFEKTEDPVKNHWRGKPGRSRSLIVDPSTKFAPFVEGGRSHGRMASQKVYCQLTMSVQGKNCKGPLDCRGAKKGHDKDKGRRGG